MTVWLLYGVHAHGKFLLQIYATEALAKQYLQDIIFGNHQPFPDYEITKATVCSTREPQDDVCNVCGHPFDLVHKCRTIPVIHGERK